MCEASSRLYKCTIAYKTQPTSSPASNLSPNGALLFHNVCYRTCHPSGILCARLVMGRFHDPVMTSRAAPIVLFARRSKQQSDPALERERKLP